MKNKLKNLLLKAIKNFNIKDLKKVLDNYENLKDKFTKDPRLKTFYEEFKLLFKMMKDYISGDYREVPWYVIAAIGSTLLYVLSPIDLIPDFILGAGYLDDASMVAICLKLIKDEVEKYKKWTHSY